jgi:hypothetical protein
MMTHGNRGLNREFLNRVALRATGVAMFKLSVARACHVLCHSVNYNAILYNTTASNYDKAKN